MSEMKIVVGNDEFGIRKCTKVASKDLKKNIIETVNISFLDKNLSLKEILTKISSVDKIAIVNEVGERLEFNTKEILNIYQEINDNIIDYPTITISI